MNDILFGRTIVYRNFYGDTWSDFAKEAKDKSVYLFGWNVAQRIYIEMKKYDCPWKIVGIIDNNKSIQGEKELPYTDMKINVFPPQILGESDDKSHIVVLICGSYISEMAEQLEQMGIKDYFSEFWLSAYKGMRYHKHQVDQMTENRLVDILYDDESKSIVKRIIEKRKTGFLDYSDLYSRGGNEYFRQEFWLPERQGVFIDAGGFDGDTIEEYDKWVQGDYKHIYSFEPQGDMADKIEEKLWKYKGKVTLIRKGLWSKSQKLSFINGDGELSGKINENGTDKIETVALDEVINEDVSFIKMDIEGAEIEALKGARQTIFKSKPKLAICVYHKKSDLWEVPFLVHDIVPQYKLSIRHFGVTCSDTVLFARL